MKYSCEQTTNNKAIIECAYMYMYIHTRMYKKKKEKKEKLTLPKGVFELFVCELTSLTYMCHVAWLLKPLSAA